MVKKIAIIQARLSSKRLPGKVMKDLNGKCILQRVIEQAKAANLIDEIWLATSNRNEDDILELVGNQAGIKVFRGSLRNVLKRFCDVVKKSNADIVVRITADNPLTDPSLIDQGIESMLSKPCDYVYFEKVPYGAGVEIVKSQALLTANKLAKDRDEFEHVTLFIKNNKELFQVRILNPKHKIIQRTDIRVTVDTLEDYIKMYKIFWELENCSKKNISLENVIKLLDNKNSMVSS